MQCSHRFRGASKSPKRSCALRPTAALARWESYYRSGQLSQSIGDLSTTETTAAATRAWTTQRWLRPTSARRAFLPFYAAAARNRKSAHADKLDLGPSISISPECIIASMVAANAAKSTARSFGIAFLATRSRQALRACSGFPCVSLLTVAAAPSGSSYRASVPRRRARSKPVSCFACAFAQLRRVHTAQKRKSGPNSSTSPRLEKPASSAM